MSEILDKTIEKLIDSSRTAEKKQLRNYMDKIDKIRRYIERTKNDILRNSEKMLKELYRKAVKIKGLLENADTLNDTAVIENSINDLYLYLTLLTKDAEKIDRSNLYLVMGLILTLTITIPYDPAFMFSSILLLVSVLIMRYSGNVYDRKYFLLGLILPLYAVVFDSYVAVSDISSIIAGNPSQIVFFELPLSIIALYLLFRSLILLFKARRLYAST